MQNKFFNDKFILDADVSKWKYLENGTVLINASFTRVGVFTYSFGDVYRPADEVLSAESLQSMILSPFTDEHPMDKVTIDNWSELSKGIIVNCFVDGEKVKGQLLVWDKEFLEILKTKKELSMGYFADLEETSGEYNGEKYQYIQRNIRYNHVSAVWFGRAGRDIHIDEDINNKIIGDKMKEEKSKETSLVELKDGYEAKILVLQKELENVQNQNKILQDKLDVYELNETLATAESIGIKVEDAKTGSDVKKIVVSKYLNMDTKDQSVEFIDGAFNSIITLYNSKTLKDVSKSNESKDVIIIDAK